MRIHAQCRVFDVVLGRCLEAFLGRVLRSMTIYGDARRWGRDKRWTVATKSLRVPVPVGDVSTIVGHVFATANILSK